MSAWTPDPPAWVRDAVFYQIFPDRFAASSRVEKPGPLEPWDAPPTASGFKGGDLLGIAEQLDDLADLGVTALYLTPVFASASNHRYHTYDYLRVDPLLGGDAALRELLDAAHARGMRVVLDGVFNHVGRGFWAFHHVAECGLASPYVDWFHLDRARLAQRGLQPYVGRDTIDGADAGYAAWWGLPALPKLNVAHPPVREHLMQVAEHWLRFGIDGWRLDVPFEIEDESFWREFRRRCRAVRADAYTVGEVWHVAPEWVRGDRFDGLMNYPLMEAILPFVAGPSLDRETVAAHHEIGRRLRPEGAPAFAARLLELLGSYAPATNAAQLNLLSSHDMPRFVTFCGGDRTAFRLGTLLQMALPGAPSVYYGDEVGLEGAQDPDCRRAFPRDGAARDESLRECVRSLIRARRAHPALRADRVEVVEVSDHAIALVRGGAGDASAQGECAVVALNTGSGHVTLDVPLAPGTRLEPVELAGFTPHPEVRVGAEGRATLALPARDGAVWIVRSA